MRKYAFLAIAALAGTLISAMVAHSQAPVRNDSLIPFYEDVRGPMCSPTDNAVGMITAMTPPDTLLFNHTRRGGAAAACNPVLAPDGHQLTLGEFKAVTGRATVKCINTGTHSALHYSGLQPNGVYSVWIAVPNPSPPPPYIGIGTLGITALSVNHFIASEAGEGQISRTTPEEDLSVFGHVGQCFLDTPIELHLVYHIDQMTHGFTPGPLNTWVVNARFLFP
ncbi:MAG: hypothetical protein ABJC10_08925 [Acidobacteriota bacterium]